MRKVLLFRVGNHEFGLDLPQVIDIRKTSTVIRESQEGARIRISTPEGIKISMYDLSMLIDKTDMEMENRDSQFMTVSAGGMVMGLKVDNVHRVISIDDERFESLPLVFGNTSVTCFPMIIKYENSLIPMINPSGIENYEKSLKKEDAEVPILSKAEETADDFDIIELTEVIEAPSHQKVDSGADKDEAADEIFEQFDTDVEADEALIPMVEEPSGLPPAEILMPEESIGIRAGNPFKNWTFLPDNESELEAFFIKMVSEKSVSRMVINIVQRIAERTVKRELHKLKAKKALFPKQTGKTSK